MCGFRAYPIHNGWPRRLSHKLPDISLGEHFKIIPNVVNIHHIILLIVYLNNPELMFKIYSTHMVLSVTKSQVTSCMGQGWGARTQQPTNSCSCTDYNLLFKGEDHAGQDLLHCTPWMDGSVACSQLCITFKQWLLNWIVWLITRNARELCHANQLKSIV